MERVCIFCIQKLDLHDRAKTKEIKKGLNEGSSSLCVRDASLRSCRHNLQCERNSTARETERVNHARHVGVVCLCCLFPNREAEADVLFMYQEVWTITYALKVSFSLSPFLCHTHFTPFFIFSNTICTFSRSPVFVGMDRNRVVNLSEEKIKDPTERHRLYKQQSAQRFSDFYNVITVKRT